MRGELDVGYEGRISRAPASGWASALQPILALMDILAFAFSLLIGVGFAVVVDRSSWSALLPVWPTGSSTITYGLATLFAITGFALSGHYNQRSSFWEETRVVWRQLAMLAMFNLALNFLTHATQSRTPVIATWLLLFLCVPLGRIACRQWLLSVGVWHRPVVIIGEGEYAIEAYEALEGERLLGLRVVGFATLEAGSVRSVTVGGEALSIFPLSSRPEAVLQKLKCHTVVITMDQIRSSTMSRLIGRLSRHGFEVLVVPPVRGLPVHGLEAQHFFNQDILFLRIQNNLNRMAAKFVKRAFDLVGGVLLLIVLLPVLAYSAFLISREDGFPILHRQKRVGREGADFEFLKFRSMVRDADDVLTQWKFENSDLYFQYVRNNFKLSDDPRVLRVGRWLRYTSIDELPQLWNVICGDMSLVGPRPLLRRELGDYIDEATDLYNQVRPGITGLWQVSGRSSTTFRDRATMDIWYVRNWSLWIDIVILLKTIRVVIRRTGAY